MKSQNVVSFRADEEVKEKLDRAARDLDVPRSELVEQAFLLGLPQAAERIKAKKLAETQSLLERLRGITLRKYSHQLIPA